MGEPILEIDDIQGHVLPGFASKHNYLLGLEIKDAVSFIDKLEPMIDEICSAASISEKRAARKVHFIKFNKRIKDNDVLIAHSISASGFKKLNVDIFDFADSKFKEGMYINATNLGDLEGSKSENVNWKFGTPSKPLDYLLIIASDSLNGIKSKKETVVQYLGGSVNLVYDEICSRLPGEKEHFGFKDGISQPAIRGRIDNDTFFSTRNIDDSDPRSKIFAKPSQPLVWPGQFIFGYPTQDTNDPTIPGALRDSLPQWSKNGSFLVLRRLRQDVSLFERTMEKMAVDVSQRYNIALDKETLMARCVGRWKDGTPLAVSPSMPDSEISEDIDRLNNFDYSLVKETEIHKEGEKIILPKVEPDFLARKCPVFSHIRKVNPRKDGTEDGTEKTISKLILRRGVPFGPAFKEGEPENIERGLLFMAYQTSIAEQFEFVQRNWANALNRPQGGGHDFIIGQPDSKKRQARYFESSKVVEISSQEEWVFTTGGEYLFSPSISGLRQFLNEAKASYLT